MDTTPISTTGTSSVLYLSFELLLSAFQENFLKYLNKLSTLPGGDIILRYIKSSYKNDPIRSLFELSLILFAINYFLSSKKKEKISGAIKLKPSEIKELCDEWQPESLVSPIESKEKWILDTIPVTKGKIGPVIDVSYNGKNYSKIFNLSSFDFLNLNNNDKIVNSAKQTIRASGVGACGPPNFYGTQDSHVRLEEDLAEFLEAEAAILYGQDFCTAPSVIPAFVKRGDVCVVDVGVSLAIQKALVVSRCSIVWYDHNDYDHLKEVLEDLKTDLDSRPVTRRFIITEGLFANFGDLPNLPKLIELKKEYKFRLFVDETYSIGVLGKNGRGISEYYGIPRSDIDITIGSLALSFASSGGFCVGARPMVHHQRLQSQAYVFSASLPPYCAKVASGSIKEITCSNIVSSLQTKTKTMYDLISKSKKLSSLIKINSDVNCPIIHIRLSSKLRTSLKLPENYGGPTRAKNLKFDESYNLESYLISKINESILENGVLTTRSKRILHHEATTIIPELLVIINDGLSKAEIEKGFKNIENGVSSTLKGLTYTSFQKLKNEF